MKEVKAIILAAGKGTRMNSDLPKVLHKVQGKSMISMVINTFSKINDISENILVLGPQKDLILEDLGPGIPYVVQEQQLGTGHAVKMAKEHLKNFSGDVLIAYGDCPMLTAQTINKFIENHQEGNAVCTVLTSHLDNPYGYGRIVKAANGHVQKIVEELDADLDIKEIKEVNSGVVLVNSKMLFKALDNIKNDNVKSEYYLTDIVGYFVDNNLRVRSFMTPNILEIQGVNTLEQLDYLNWVLKSSK